MATIRVHGNTVNPAHEVSCRLIGGLQLRLFVTVSLGFNRMPRSRSDFIKWIAAVQVLQHASWQRYRTGGLVSVERNSDLASDSSGCVCVAQEIGDTIDAIREVFAGLHPVFFTSREKFD